MSNQDYTVSQLMALVVDNDRVEVLSLAGELFQDDHMALTLLGPADTGKKEFEKMLLQ